MGYRKLSDSAGVAKAKTRLEAMKHIDARKGRIIDYGDAENPLTSDIMQARIIDYNTKKTVYNNLLHEADGLSNELDALQAEITEDSTRVLASAIGKFGTNASEIEELGGKRKADRKKRGTNNGDGSTNVTPPPA